MKMLSDSAANVIMDGWAGEGGEMSFIIYDDSMVIITPSQFHLMPRSLQNE